MSARRRDPVGIGKNESNPGALGSRLARCRCYRVTARLRQSPLEEPMADLAEMIESWTPRVLSVFRIVVALLYLQHPLAKFFGFPHVAAFDNLQPFSLVWVAGV